MGHSIDYWRGWISQPVSDHIVDQETIIKISQNHYREIESLASILKQSKRLNKVVPVTQTVQDGTSVSCSISQGMQGLQKMQS